MDVITTDITQLRLCTETELEAYALRYDRNVLAYRDQVHALTDRYRADLNALWHELNTVQGEVIHLLAVSIA